MLGEVTGNRQCETRRQIETMSDKSSWIGLLKGPITAILMSLVLGWLAKSRLRDRGIRPSSLFLPRSVLVIGLVSFGFFAGCSIARIVVPNETVTWWTISGFAAFALMTVPLIAAYFLENHQLSEDGSAIRTSLGVKKYLRWTELRSVRHSAWMNWFRLETQSGVIGRMLIGLPEFAQMLLRNSPRSAIDSRALLLLEATAAGRPPPISH